MLAFGWVAKMQHMLLAASQGDLFLRLCDLLAAHFNDFCVVEQARDALHQRCHGGFAIPTIRVGG